MNILCRWSAIVSMLISTGCTPILKEVRYAGGYPGYILDKRTFDASASKQLALLRATLILAMAAEMSRATVRGDDGDAFSNHLAAAAKEINFAAADVYNTRTDGTGNVCVTAQDEDRNCSGFYANFEGDIPLIEQRILKVMLAALPTEKARKFLDDASQGNILGAAWGAVGAVAKGAGGLHFAFGRYRSGLEIVAEQMGSKCRGSSFDPTNMTVIEAADCLGLSQSDLFSNPEHEATRDDLRGNKQGLVQRGAFLALMRTVATACVDLPYSGDVATIANSRNVRGDRCNDIGFEPKARPYRIKPNAGGLDAPVDGTAPAAAPTTTVIEPAIVGGG